ncbi:MAG: transglutaminase-like domain-containing protein [Thermoguttaceae bacterium]
MHMTSPNPKAFAILIALLSISFAPGCSETTAEPPALTGQAETSAPTESIVEAELLAEDETWDVYFMQGSRVGYGQTTIRHATESGRKVVRIEGLNHLAIRRFGEVTRQDLRFSCVETPDGELIEFDTEMQMGSVPMRTVGRVDGNRLRMDVTTAGKKVSTSIPWSPDDGGPYAIEASLLRRPMRPGETRTVRALVPGFNQVATTRMTARDFEPVELLTGTSDLLRIDTTMRFSDGNTLDGSVWTNRQGDALKTRTEAMAMETFRVSKTLALEKTEPGEFDLGIDVAVKIDRPLVRPHATKKATYRVHLDGGDPAAVFVSGVSQRVKSIDPHTAEITVYAIRPGNSHGNPAATDDPPTDDDRQPNNLIQSDDARITAMAVEATGDETEPWQIALTLERFVSKRITNKGFSQAFATAAEVAENPEGDCTEHAVLLTALARAKGIPARVAIGLVYMQGNAAFGYHMWSEVYIDGRWIPLDATLAQGGIGAAHLKLAHTNLKGASAYSSFLPVVQVTGRLKIEVVDIE